MASLFDQAFAPYAMPQSNNVLAQVLGAQDTGPIGIPQVDTSAPLATPNVRAPRERASLLDIIGGIADTVATVGGSAPMYQPTIDARADRARQMEMDEIRKRISEQTIQQNEQTLGSFGREQLGQALGGIVNSENPVADWQQIAQIAGIPADKAAAIGAELERNPAMARQLATVFGYEPQRQGSPSAIESEYALRAATLGREAADEWLMTEGQSTAAPKRRTYSINAGDRIEEYDIETGQRVRSIPVGAKPSATRGKAQESLEGLQSAFRANRSVITDMRRAIDDLAEAGSINAPGQSALDRATASAYRNLPFVEQVFNEKGFDARERLQSSAIAAITALEPLIQQAQGAGMPMTSKMMDTPKELEVRLQAIVNSKTKEAALEGWRRFKQRYEEAEAELQRMMKRAPAAAGGSRPTTPRAANPALEAELRRRGILR